MIEKKFQIHLLFLVDHTNEISLHTIVLFPDRIIKISQLFHLTLGGFEYSGSYSGHKFDDILKGSGEVVILVDYFLLLLLFSRYIILCLLHLFCYLIQLKLQLFQVHLTSVLADHIFVNGQDWEMQFLSVFDVPKQSAPIVIEGIDKLAFIYKIHDYNYIWSLKDKGWGCSASILQRFVFVSGSRIIPGGGNRNIRLSLKLLQIILQLSTSKSMRLHRTKQSDKATKAQFISPVSTDIPYNSE